MATDSRCNLHKSILVILLWLCSSRQLQSNEAPKYAYNSTMLNVKGNFTNKTNYCNCTNDTSSQPEQQVRIKRHIFCDTKINTMNRVERRHIKLGGASFQLFLSDSCHDALQLCGEHFVHHDVKKSIYEELNDNNLKVTELANRNICCSEVISRSQISHFELYIVLAV